MPSDISTEPVALAAGTGLGHHASAVDVTDGADDPDSNINPDNKISKKGFWGHAFFWVLSAAFFFEPLTTDRLLVPTSSRHFQPWAQAAEQSESGRSASNPLMGDSLVLTVPWRSYNGEMLRAGRLPFWNPHIFCGYPHLAALQSNALYPPVALLDLWDPLRGIAWAMAFHLAVAGSLMFVFLRRIGVSPWPAVIGAVLFELNGFFLVRMSAPSYVFSGVWTPLLLLGLSDIVRSRSWRPTWKVTCAVAMGLLGGHPQILLYMLLIGGVFFLAELLAAVSSRPLRLLPGALRPVMLATCAVIIGLLLAGFQLVPFLELMSESGRSAAEYGSFRKVALPAFALLQAFVPDLFGNPAGGGYWLPSVASMVDPVPSVPTLWGLNYCGENLYTGVVPLVLAAIAVFADRRRHVLVFGGVFTGAFLILLGTPVMRFFFLLVPVLRSSRPDRLVFVAMVAISVLAAFGCEVLLRDRQADQSDQLPPKPTWVPWALVISCLVAVLWPVCISPGWAAYREAASALAERLSPPPPEVTRQATVNLCLAIVAVLMLLLGSRSRRLTMIAGFATVAAVAGPLFVFGWKFNPTQQQPLLPPSKVVTDIRQLVPPGTRIARLAGGAVLPPNTAQLAGIDDVNGSSPAGLRRYLDLIKAIDPPAVRKDKYFRGFHNPRVSEGALLDILSVGLLLSQKRLPLPHEKVLAPALFGYERPTALGLYRLVGAVERYTDLEDARTRLADPSFDPATTALVASGSEAAGMPSPPAGATLRLPAVTLRRKDAHRIVLEVETAHRRLLVSSDVSYPGWIAELDGARVPVQMVNTAFLGVVVPAGRHQVELRYVPRSFVAGCFVSFLGLLTFALVQLLSRPRKAKANALDTPAG